MQFHTYITDSYDIYEALLCLARSVDKVATSVENGAGSQWTYQMILENVAFDIEEEVYFILGTIETARIMIKSNEMGTDKEWRYPLQGICLELVTSVLNSAFKNTLRIKSVAANQPFNAHQCKCVAEYIYIYCDMNIPEGYMGQSEI